MSSRAAVKSVGWCEDTSTLLYTTENQLRYLMPSGDAGAVATIPQPLYICMVKQEKVVCLTRKVEVKVLNINNAEYRFKTAVLNNNVTEIKTLINSGQILGQSQLQFLRNVGRP